MLTFWTLLLLDCWHDIDIDTCFVNCWPAYVVGLIPFVKLIDNFDASYEYLTNEGTVFTFKTNKDAPRYRVINIDLDRPDPSNWVELIPQHEVDVLEEAICVNGNNLITIYMQDVKVWYFRNLICLFRLSFNKMI